jgi:hypothetical protein
MDSYGAISTCGLPWCVVVMEEGRGVEFLRSVIIDFCVIERGVDRNIL